MRLSRCLLSASPLLALVFAGTCGAVPVLVELKIRDPLAAEISTPSIVDESAGIPDTSPGKGKSGAGATDKKNDSGKGKSGNTEHGGKPVDSLTKADLKSLTLWLSTDGVSWRKLNGEVVGLEANQITAKVDAKGNVATDDQISFFGLPTTDITGESATTFYLGVSTSSTSFEGSRFTTSLVSWQYLTPNNQGLSTISIPEPSVWPLFTTGLFGLGAVLATRRKR